MAPTPVVLTKPNSPSPVDQSRSVPEFSRGSEASADPVTIAGLARATTNTASPTTSRVEPNNEEAAAVSTAADTTNGTAEQHAAPTPISAQDTDAIAPTPAAAATPSANKASPISRPVRASRTSKAATTATSAGTAPPTPNTDAARTAEDAARAAAVRESKKAASAMRKEKELQKKQSQAVQRLRKANADADSEQVSLASLGCGYCVCHVRLLAIDGIRWLHQMEKQQLSANIEKDLAARHRGMRFPDVLRFYVDHKNVRTGTSDTNWWNDRTAIEKGKLNNLGASDNAKVRTICVVRLAMM